MYADENVIRIKHDVLYEVAKLAFAGELEEKRDNIAMSLIPGPTPQFRCCIYKEREIIRQRVRLAEGKAPGVIDDGNVIQVISSACEDCPISSYTVTENCQNCIGKACINACKFGAIEVGRDRSHIDPSKCKECGKCAQACPYNAIAHLKRPCKFSCPVNAITYDEHGISIIDKNKCIRCGKCIHSCPFGAIGSKTFIVQVVDAIRSGKHVYAMAAPATEGQFGEDITMASWKKAMKEVGFTDFFDVGLGGDMTAAYEAEEWAEAYKDGKKKVTSCCPAFVNMVRLHYPELAECVSTTVSPMCAVSRLIKARDPEAVTVFIGPMCKRRSDRIHLRQAFCKFRRCDGCGTAELKGVRGRDRRKGMCCERCGRVQEGASSAQGGKTSGGLHRGYGVRGRLCRRTERLRRPVLFQEEPRCADFSGGRTRYSREPRQLRYGKHLHAPRIAGRA